MYVLHEDRRLKVIYLHVLVRVNTRCHGNLSQEIVYAIEGECVWFYMVSQAYVKGREATPFTTSNHFEMQSLHLTALSNVCIYIKM